MNSMDRRGTKLKVIEIPLEEIGVNQSFNNRFEISPETCRTLAASIEQTGLLTPVVVRRAVATDATTAPYILLAGFRRYIAFKYLLKRDAIPASVIPTEIDDQINLVENIERKSLSVYEEAMSIKKLLDAGYTKVEVAGILSRSNYWLDTRVNFLRLPDEVQLMVQSGDLNLLDVNKLAKGKPHKAVSDAKVIIKDRQARSEAGKSRAFKKKANAKSKATIIYQRVQKLLNYLFARDDCDDHKIAVVALLWAQGEAPTERLFEEMGLSAKEALAFERS